MGVDGKYFIVVSKLTGGLVLEVATTGTPAAGTSVLMRKKTGANNQQWFVDPVTTTIRSRGNPSLCLTINASNRLGVNSYTAGNANQTWVLNRGRRTIDNKADSNKVLDVVGSATNEGAEVCSYTFRGTDNQIWSLEARPKVYFYVQSQLNGNVLDVLGGNSASGTGIISFHKTTPQHDNQLWFEDIDGNLRSKLNENVVLDANGKDGTLVLGKDNVLKSRTYWSFQGDRIVNVFKTDEVLDIRDSNTNDAVSVIAFKYHGGNNQKWKLVFV